MAALLEPPSSDHAEVHGIRPAAAIVVLPTANVADVALTVGSALRMQYDVTQVIVPDDGTVDGLREWVARASLKDSRVKGVTLREPKRAARLLMNGAEVATAPLLALCEAGTWLAPDALDSVGRTLADQPCEPGVTSAGLVRLTGDATTTSLRRSVSASASDGSVRPALLSALAQELGLEPVTPVQVQARRRRRLPTPVMRTFLGALGLALLAVLLLTKSDRLSDPRTSWFVVAYTLFVTTFELSRLIGAMLYPRTQRRLAADTEAMPGFEPSISFVIPCMNEEQAIENTITQCFAADYPAEKVEVIVVNDGSTDRTLGVLLELQQRFPSLILVDWRTNRGKRHGMAEGFRRATNDIIIQLDSDSFIDPSTVRDLVAPFSNPEVGAVCAHADPENADTNLLTRMQAAYYFMSFRIMKAAESSFLTVFCCSGCSSAYRRELVLPQLDVWLGETFLGKPVTWGDDRALTNRVLKAGYRTVYTDKARAWTICPEHLRQLLKQQVRWKKGWFVNSVFLAPFLARKQPFVAFTYFFPLMFLTLITPFIAARALIYGPLVQGDLPTYYLLGILLLATLVTIFYRIIAPDHRYWPYLFVWSALNMLVLSFVLFYALFTIQDRGWGTR